MLSAKLSTDSERSFRKCCFCSFQNKDEFLVNDHMWRMHPLFMRRKAHLLDVTFPRKRQLSESDGFMCGKGTLDNSENDRCNDEECAYNLKKKCTLGEPLPKRSSLVNIKELFKSESPFKQAEAIRPNSPKGISFDIKETRARSNIFTNNKKAGDNNEQDTALDLSVRQKSKISEKVENRGRVSSSASRVNKMNRSSYPANFNLLPKVPLKTSISFHKFTKTSESCKQLQQNDISEQTDKEDLPNMIRIDINQGRNVRRKPALLSDHVASDTFQNRKTNSQPSNEDKNLIKNGVVPAMNEKEVRLLEAEVKKINCFDPNKGSAVVPVRIRNTWTYVRAKRINGVWLIQVPNESSPYVLFEDRTLKSRGSVLSNRCQNTHSPLVNSLFEKTKHCGGLMKKLLSQKKSCANI